MSAAARTLDRPRLGELLSGVPFVSRVEIRESTGSTNDELRALAARGAPAGTVVVANHQRSGRGRLGRSWHSPPGLGLYLSVLFRPSAGVTAPTRWTLISALAACEACREIAKCSIDIEWPNDLYHGGRKLAGTLTELRSAAGAVHEIVIGTGFNVQHAPADFPDDLRGVATSLAIARGGREVDREGLASAYVDRLAKRVRALEQGRWDELRRAWQDHAPRAEGCAVTVARENGTQIDGVTRGVDASGALRVELDDDAVVTVHSGESVVYRGD